MPKPTRRALFVSNSAIQSFQKLHEQIEAAEKILRKLPGARLEETRICVSGILVNENANVEAHLLFDGNPGELTIEYEYLNGRNANESIEMVRLVDLVTTKRIEVARKIPDLLSIAKDAEQKVAEMAENAALEIEHAISQFEIGS
jgi:hypothetical protein